MPLVLLKSTREIRHCTTRTEVLVVDNMIWVEGDTKKNKKASRGENTTWDRETGIIRLEIWQIPRVW